MSAGVIHRIIIHGQKGRTRTTKYDSPVGKREEEHRDHDTFVECPHHEPVKIVSSMGFQWKQNLRAHHEEEGCSSKRATESQLRCQRYLPWD